MMKNKIKKILNKIELKRNIRLLEKELQEEKEKNAPLIDLANKYKSQLRGLKIQNTKMKKQIEQLKEEIKKQDNRVYKLFGKEEK